MIRHSRLTAVGILLCLLAALFAVEAKVAWYSPAGSSGAVLSCAKARPAETPKAAPTRVTWPDVPALYVAGIVIRFALALVFVTAAVLLSRTGLFRPVFSESPGFSEALFFRPPPAC